MIEYDCEIAVNGQTININEFVVHIFSNTILGMVSSLDGLPSEFETIDLKISKKGR